MNASVNCDMPLPIYADWLEDQGVCAADLREFAAVGCVVSYGYGDGYGYGYGNGYGYGYGYGYG